MANLAEQLKAELTERAKNSESCKKYLLDYVMNEFRKGYNPVEIYIKDTAKFSLNTKLSKRLGLPEDNYKSEWIKFKYEEGKHFAKCDCRASDWVDITDMEESCLYCVDGKDESDKTLFLRSEGFKVNKTWIYGRGDLLQITF